MTSPGSQAGRVQRLRARLAEQHLDGVLISQPESRYYLSGFTGHDLPPRDSAGYLFVTPDRALLLTDRRTTEQAEQEAPHYHVQAYEAGSQGPEVVGQAIASSGAKRVGFEATHLPYAVWQVVQHHAAGVEMVDASGLVDSLRVVKDADELRRLTLAIDVLDRCFSYLCGVLRPGQTERQVARLVDQYLREHADGPSFPSIVASGPNGSMPHAVPSERVISEGEGITIDIGARAEGYCSDMTRTICLGEPKDARLVDVYELVLRAQTAAEAAVQVGMTGKEADAVARDVLAAGGQGEHFTHSLGHGIGLEVHEPPWLSSVRGTEPLAAGMVFSVEPGVYLPGWGGVRIEDLVVLEPGGARVLSHSPKALAILR